ncbi:spermidine/putrescine ABC transporter permease [Shouchella clausii]|nr:Spermidine Putrescine ABC transporter permease component PotB [Shouchella clausii]GIN06340.1 spermidine/putrescine ABC transporter permease [Shouchella clausii]GIN15152.1 spermidine/putrescine ABC transporter permease [Shouchella clausii]SHL72955.1 putative spermidine/putrescine transport system permease protein [Shouchella rhizosphaerae]
MNRSMRMLLLIPGLLFLTVFMLIPLVLTISSTFVENGSFSLDGYFRFLGDAYFLEILWTTLFVALLTTFCCVILAFPAAYYISKLKGGKKAIMLMLAIFPLLVSPVVRSFSWMIILGRNGLLNEFLMATGLINEPLSILYTPAAVAIGLIHLFLPLMIVTLVGVMENIDADLFLAAESLGASKAKAFLKVMVPLCVPGLVIGSTLVFVGSFTAYTTPALLGGQQRVISTFLYQNAITLNDWHAAAMIATIMIVITFVVTGLFQKIAAILNPRG